MKIVTLSEIRAHLDLDLAIKAIVDGFTAYSAGKVTLAAVGHLPFPTFEGDCHIKAASMVGIDVFAVKIATGFPHNGARGLPTSNGLMMILDATTGAPLCLLLDEGHLTDIRTAIAGGVAAKRILPRGADTLGIVGTGIQGRLQAELAARATGIRRIAIWGRRGERADALAAELRATGLDAFAVPALDQLCAVSQVVITATLSRAPLITEAMATPRMRLVTVGADAPGKQEVESSVVARMDIRVADSIDQCFDHGELGWAFREGLIGRADVVELGAMLANPNAIPDDSSVLVDLTGLGVQDLQIANSVWQRLRIGVPTAAGKPAQ